MTDQVLTKETGQKGTAKSFREHALASVELLRGGATARSGAIERKTVILGPDTPRFNERHLWQMAIEEIPITHENLSRALIRPDTTVLEASSESGQKE